MPHWPHHRAETTTQSVLTLDETTPQFRTRVFLCSNLRFLKTIVDRLDGNVSDLWTTTWRKRNGLPAAAQGQTDNPVAEVTLAVAVENNVRGADDVAEAAVVAKAVRAAVTTTTKNQRTSQATRR